MDKIQFKKELQDLIKEGDSIYYASVLAYDENFPKNYPIEIQKLAIDARNRIQNPQEEYQFWYPKTYRLVKYLAPERLAEFEKHYNDYIKVWLIAVIDPPLHDAHFNRFEAGFRTQIYILSGIAKSFDTPFFNLERDIRHDIYKSTMDIAKELQEEDPRIAGAIASVMLEVHLKKIAIKHGIEDKETNSIADYNNFLKTKGVYDGILAEQIKPCRKIRNKCVHTNQGDPSVGEVSTIIHIADRVIAEVN